MPIKFLSISFANIFTFQSTVEIMVGLTIGKIYHRLYLCPISIHAPRMGATVGKYNIKIYLWYFNPRTHAGCDIFSAYGVNNGFKISIHAPLRGATKKERYLWETWSFQSTHPCGVRLQKYIKNNICVALIWHI